MKRIITLVVICVVCCNGCREQYEPNLRSSEQSFLVVEGNLNGGRDTTVVRLTRTFKLDDTASLKIENNAQVTVEGSDNTIRVLSDRGNGDYISPDLNLVINTSYRLRIRTADGKEYSSDYIIVRKTPPIDSISWEREENGVRIFANTKDPSNATRYYRWEFDETWEIRSYYPPYVIYENGHIRNRIFPAEDVSTCWKYDHSHSILLANSTRLQDDIIYKAPLNLIPNGDEKLSVRYSIMVRQYVLDKEGYNFYELMKKNTEEIGSIFTPQPSEVRGNIYCVSDANEYVLGYITASTVEQQRIFIDDQWIFRQDCPSQKVPKNADSVAFFFGTGLLSPYADISLPPSDAHYKGSYPRCVDCTERGGSLIKPSYW